MGSDQPKRALIVVRLSRVTEATTSPERQLEKCREICEKRGYVEVDVAEDLDVSAGATSPFTRPKLGKWLHDRHDEFDVLVFYRMDRLVRKLADLAEMMAWSKKHNVTLVSATESFLDLDTPFGDVIALLVAKVAEMELEAISARNLSSSTYLIRSGRWRGGIPPWGYRPELDEDKKWQLVQDPEQVAVIKEVVELVLPPKREPLRKIAHDLTEKGVLTPKDAFAKHQGREVQGYLWHSSPLKRILSSRAMLGQIVTRDPVLDAKGQPIRDERGQRILGEEIVVTEGGVPLQRAEPILDPHTHTLLLAELADRENRKEPTKRSNSLLRQVLRCGECGRAAYRLKGGTGRRPRYRCASAQYRNSCGNRTVDLEWADEQVEQKVLSALGPMPLMRRVWQPGSDVSAELDEVNQQLEDFTDLLMTPQYKRGTVQREKLDENVTRLVARQEELQDQPTVPAGWRYEPTGEAVAQWWARSDLEERGAWLREHGATATWLSHTEGGRENDKGNLVGGRTKIDSFEVDLGKPDLRAADLPEPIAEQARLVREGWAADHDGPAIATALAEVWWKQGREDPAEVEERLLDEQQKKK